MVELIPYFRRKRPKHIPFGAAHTHIAYIRKYPPGEKNALQIKSLAAYASETNKIIQIQQFGGGQLRQFKVNVDFPRVKCILNWTSGEKSMVLTVKSRTERTSDKHIARPKRERKRSSYLDSRSYFEATGPTCFIFLYFWSQNLLPEP